MPYLDTNYTIGSTLSLGFANRSVTRAEWWYHSYVWHCPDTEISSVVCFWFS